MKENLYSKQLELNQIKQPKPKSKKGHKIMVSIGLDGVSKTDDESYVLSTIKFYSKFSFVFSVVPKKVELLKISKMM